MSENDDPKIAQLRPHEGKTRFRKFVDGQWIDVISELDPDFTLADGPVSAAEIDEVALRRASHEIALRIQFNDFGRFDDEGNWKCTGAQIDLLRKVCDDAARAVLSLNAEAQS